MNVKELKEFLNQFPDETVVNTQTNNHYSFDGIMYADYFEIEGSEKHLFIGNCSQLQEHRHGYNIRGFKLIKKFSKHIGFNVT